MDEDVKNAVIETIDSYNGCLGDNHYYLMEDLNEFYRDCEPLELLTRVFYGYDEDTSTEDKKTEFNPNREYFTYSGYGNLVSTNYIDYSGLLDDEDIIKYLLDGEGDISYITGCEKLNELIDLYNDIDMNLEDIDDAIDENEYNDYIEQFKNLK